MEQDQSFGVFCASLVSGQHGVDLAAVLPDNEDDAIANGKSGAEQFWHFVGERRGEGNRASGDGIADTNSGCCLIRERRRLDVFTDQLNFLARN